MVFCKAGRHNINQSKSRISGRFGLRAGWGDPNLEFVHINEIKGGIETSAHLVKYDSVHGRWQPSVSVVDNKIQIDNQTLTFSEYGTPQEIPWEEYGVDLVIESSGKFRSPDTLNPYFDRGVKKVIVAAPVKQEALNIVYGINDDLYDPH